MGQQNDRQAMRLNGCFPKGQSGLGVEGRVAEIKASSARLHA